ncbi:NRDE family protein [Salinicoccus halodurans]|uniref:Uncharacterized conserved protein, contains NRDE domain n=1 Tax=Salinicoccus halodurans TaxID=407035 RepID=A0A0F7HMS9_9STAP|nr:NRDE family protein [Salinicoccus halodurans]AKG74288.1 hypothetical protein AAT16_08620 [Salinicoccus halodurans]SFK94033.1 Uncharacterized conserved protein, contains NRDE domain [Salinicoccus halodurans]
MCLINFQLNDHEKYKLILAANRDEEYHRPTAPANFWEDNRNILAGRDLRGTGTWLGITEDGRIAALTNIRNSDELLKTNMKTRGLLVSGFLQKEHDPSEYLEGLRFEASDYSGFNLIVGSSDALYYMNNYEKEVVEIGEGVHGLSNHHLDTAWPKVIKGRKKLEEITSQKDFSAEELFELLKDTDTAPPQNLPDTGLSKDLETMLSPLFIETENYGTRCSTVILIDKYNNVEFIERTYDRGRMTTEERYTFTIR